MDYYVSPKNGNDAASGSRTNAWRSIGRALAAASSGDIIYVMGPLVVGKDIHRNTVQQWAENKDRLSEGGGVDTVDRTGQHNLYGNEPEENPSGCRRPPGKVPKEDRTFPDLSGKRPDPEARLVGYATQEQIDEHMAGVRKPEM